MTRKVNKPNATDLDQAGWVSSRERRDYSHRTARCRMTADESANIETTSTRLVYENRWMRVREDTIRRRDGSTGIYGVVEKPDFVIIVPVEDDGRVHLME